MAPDVPPAPVIKTLIVPCAPAKAFHYFTADFHQWWPMGRYSVVASSSGFKEQPAAVIFEAGVGGRLFERSHAGAKHVWGTVLCWQPPEKVAFSFHPGRDPRRAQTVEVVFSPAPGGTRVILTHKGWENLGPDAGSMRDEYNSGWEAVFMISYRDYVDAVWA